MDARPLIRPCHPSTTSTNPKNALLEVERDARDLVGVLERQAQELIEGVRALAHLSVCVLL